MMMTSTTEPTADARTAAELEEAVRDGAEVTAEQLRAARDRDLLAGLHGEADRRRADRKAAEAREAAVEQLHADVRAFAEGSVGDDGPLGGLCAKLHELGVEYAAAVAEHNRQVVSLGARARALGLGERDYHAGSPVGSGPGDVVFWRLPGGGRGVARVLPTDAAGRAVDAGLLEGAQAAAPPADRDGPREYTHVLTAGGVPLRIGELTEAWQRQIGRGELTVISRERFEALVAEQVSR